MLITSGQPCALRMKEIADRKNNTRVNSQTELLKEIKNIFDKIEHAAKRGKYETIYILDENVSKNSEIVNIIMKSLQKEGFTAEIKTRLEGDLLFVSWNDVIEEKAEKEVDISFQRNGKDVLKDEGATEMKNSVGESNKRENQSKSSTNDEILELGTKVLINELGYPGFIRFINLILRGL